MAALKVTATIGPNIYTVEGEFTYDREFKEAFADFILRVEGKENGADQAKVDALTSRLHTSTDDEARAIAESTPTRNQGDD